jgi:hypothetical protein
MSVSKDELSSRAPFEERFDFILTVAYSLSSFRSNGAVLLLPQAMMYFPRSSGVITRSQAGNQEPTFQWRQQRRRCWRRQIRPRSSTSDGRGKPFAIVVVVVVVIVVVFVRRVRGR